MTEPTAARPRVFISYSHKDERWKDQLLRHLRVAAREGDFEIWSDRDIQAGDAWHEKIVQALEGCSLALVLVSTDFLDSEFIRREEVPRLLKRREEDGMRIVPVILKSCLWKRIDWLPPLQARPRDGEPLAKWRGNRLEAELAKIAEEVWDVLQQAAPAAQPSRSAQFLAAFRQRLAPAFSRWDLGTVGVTQTGGAGRPIEANLDEIYLPLRLAQGFNISKTNRGEPITPQDLLARKLPLTIRGAAGAGKTTWMRWTFRQLLRTESAFPLMLVLRDLARKWQDPSSKGAARALDAFLEGWIAEHGLKDQEGVLQELLASQDRPRPVLLVDGWDEVGPLGEELRQKLLGFLQQYPRVLAVVTSRPYGEGRPSHAEGFEVLDIQPLSDAEIADLARRFFTHCYGEEEVAVNREAERFQRALKRNPEPEALARTPLLLTMMLLISRSRPLPDKRHLLYEACIDNLLTAMPDRKEEEGALRLREQWRPDDSEERLRVAAALAATVQSAGYRSKTRSPIVQTWDQMAGLLSSEWTERQRMGFLAWLAGPAGLLTDRSDGTLAFTHLSFKEFLTAWHLNATIEGTEERIDGFQKRLSTTAWWETLRLWAALIQRQNRERLDPVLRALAEGKEEGLAFVGTILADGLGSDERFRDWLERFLEALAWRWPSETEICARAWSASRQDERKAELARFLAGSAPAQRWLGWLRHRDFAVAASLPIRQFRPPSSIASSSILLKQLAGNPAKSEASVAFGRILCSGPPLWPIEPLTVGLLQVWPGDRRLVGLRFQMAQCSGAGRADLTALARTLLKPREWTEELRDLARDLPRDWARYWARYWARELPGDGAAALTRERGYEWGRYWGSRWTSDWARHWARYWAREWPHYWIHDWAHDWAVSEGIDSQKPWFEDFASAEISSSGRIMTRSSLAPTANNPNIPELLLLAEACRLSLSSDRGAGQLNSLLRQHRASLDPLWPALARHLAGRSTGEDRTLLVELAQHPEKREPPLSWGLRFIVRGDVMLDDGSVVTLDDLADEVGLPHLPYLEDMPVD